MASWHGIMAWHHGGLGSQICATAMREPASLPVGGWVVWKRGSHWQLGGILAVAARWDMNQPGKPDIETVTTSERLQIVDDVLEAWQWLKLEDIL